MSAFSASRSTQASLWSLAYSASTKVKNLLRTPTTMVAFNCLLYIGLRYYSSNH